MFRVFLRVGVDRGGNRHAKQRGGTKSTTPMLCFGPTKLPQLKEINHYLCWGRGWNKLSFT